MANSKLLPWLAVAVLTGAVIWTNRRDAVDRNIGSGGRTNPDLAESAPSHGKPAPRTKSAIRTPSPASRDNGDFEQLGAAAARLGFETVSARLAELTKAADKEAFIRGAFRHAAGMEPKEVLDWAWHLPSGHCRDTALMTLLCEWSGMTTIQWLGKPDFMSAGIAATLGGFLLDKEKATPRDIAAFAWNFTSGQNKGMLIGRAAAMLAPANPDEAWAMGNRLEYAEADSFVKTIIRNWATRDLPGLTRWLESSPERMIAEDPLEILMSHLVQTDPKAAANFLSRIPADSVNRTRYVTEIGNDWAMRDTRAALDWAESLPAPADRDAALASIRQLIPVGIGAAMIGDTIGNIVPDSPASRSGLAPGDRILALTKPDGAWIETNGMEPGDLVKNIRGPENTNVTLRIQAKDGGIRNVMITRRQILMKQP